MTTQRRYPRRLACARSGWALGLILTAFAPCLVLSEVRAQEGQATSPEQGPAAEKSLEQLLTEANQLLSKEEWDKAAEVARQAARRAPQSPGGLQRAAEVMYLSGHSQESLPLFDRVVELAPNSAAHNWQRGIALCSQGEFEKGAEQFKTHHEVNPDDVENSAWYFLCIAKTQSVEAARKTVIPSRGDGRQPMMSVLKMLQGKLEPEEVLQAARENSTEGRSRQTAQFYADLYVGLYYDSLGDAEQAAKYLQRSQSYGISGYMVRAAQVYLDDRFSANTPSPKDEVK